MEVFAILINYIWSEVKMLSLYGVYALCQWPNPIKYVVKLHIQQQQLDQVEEFC